MSPGRTGVLRGVRWPEPLLEALALPPRDTAEWMAEHTRVLKSDAYSRVGLLELGGELCYLKYYRQKSIGQQMLFWMGRGRGVRAYDRAEQLAERGVSVPEARACVLIPGGMLLLTEGLADSRDLKAMWQAGTLPDEPATLLKAAAQALSNLHSAGFAHGDCKWSNLLWNGGRFWLVDLEAVEKSPLGGRKQARDLARFTINAEDLSVDRDHFRHFLEGYCEESGIPRDAVVDRMMRDLQRYRARHRDKYGERGAPLI